jgi:hypothetical protein
VVREHEIHAAGVDVEAVAEVLERHRRALDVPARAALAPRARPSPTPLLGAALPQREIERVALGLVASMRAPDAQLVDVALGQLAVAGNARTA